MKKTIVFALTLFATTAFANTDVQGKSFCADDDGVTASYAFKSNNMVKISIGASDSKGDLLHFGWGHWELTKKDAVKITFGPLGRLFSPAVTDYKVLTQKGLSLQDLHSGVVFSKCK